VFLELVFTCRRLDHRERNDTACGAEQRLREPSCGEAECRDDGAAANREECEHDNLDRTSACFDALKLSLATESGARFSLVTFTLIGAALLPLQLAAAYVGLRVTGAIA